MTEREYGKDRPDVIELARRLNRLVTAKLTGEVSSEQLDEALRPLADLPSEEMAGIDSILRRDSGPSGE